MPSSGGVVNISQRGEAAVRRLIGEQPEAAGSRSFKKLEAIFAELLELGFSEAQCERALRATSSLSDALDWLCLNIPNTELPARFSVGEREDGSQPSAKMEVIAAKEQPGQKPERKREAVDERLVLKGKKAAGADTTEDASGENKEWILQYMAKAQEEEQREKRRAKAQAKFLGLDFGQQLTELRAVFNRLKELLERVKAQPASAPHVPKLKGVMGKLGKSPLIFV